MHYLHNCLAEFMTLIVKHSASLSGTTPFYPRCFTRGILPEVFLPEVFYPRCFTRDVLPEVFWVYPRCFTRGILTRGVLPEMFCADYISGCTHRTLQFSYSYVSKMIWALTHISGVKLSVRGSSLFNKEDPPQDVWCISILWYRIEISHMA